MAGLDPAISAAVAVASNQREKNLKHWPRAWKLDLIVAGNPDWSDLYDNLA